MNNEYMNNKHLQNIYQGSIVLVLLKDIRFIKRSFQDFLIFLLKIKSINKFTKIMHLVLNLEIIFIT